jgi:hypothetical protein
MAACLPSLDDLQDGRSCGANQKACLNTCVNLDDPAFGCGSSATCEACAFTNARASCRDGKCVIAICEIPFDNCDNNDANGCETNTDTNVDRCGSCGNKCNGGAALANASPACRTGVCGITCAAGFGDCNGNTKDGCETDVNTSAQHCGKCGQPCSGQCIGGQCQ